MSHETHCGLVHYLIQDHQVVILQLTVGTMKVVVQKFEQLVMLLCQVWEVDEESAAHITFHRLHSFRPGWPVVLHQEVTIFE